MTYDLTSLFTTVAAASASIVAILGGFIASKLISISGERKSVLSKIDEVEVQLKAKRKEQDKLQKKASEDAAIIFIRTNIASLIDGTEFDDVLKLNFFDGVTKEELRGFWEKARAICEEIIVCCKAYGKYFKDEIKVNQHNIPIDIAKKYHNDYFAYNVSREVGEKYINQIMYYDGADRILQKNFSPGRGSVMQTMLDIKQFSDIEAEIKWLNYKKNELKEEKTRLSRPEGIKAGIIVFALFSIICIIIPLLLSPFSTDSLCLAWVLKILIIALFVGGLTGIVIYFVKMFNWKEGSK